MIARWACSWDCVVCCRESVGEVIESGQSILVSVMPNFVRTPEGFLDMKINEVHIFTNFGSLRQEIGISWEKRHPFLCGQDPDTKNS